VLKDREYRRWRTSIESKQREKYETNQINQNIGVELGLRGIVGLGACADHNNHNHDRPRNGYEHNPADDYQRCGQHCHLHAGFGLLHVPNSVSCGASPLLLHQRHNRGRPDRSYRKFVGNPPGHAGDCLLLNSGRPGHCAQSSIDPTCACDQTRGNDYDHHYDEAVVAKLFSSRSFKGAREKLAGAFLCR